LMPEITDWSEPYVHAYHYYFVDSTAFEMSLSKLVPTALIRLLSTKWREKLSLPWTSGKLPAESPAASLSDICQLPATQLRTGTLYACQKDFCGTGLTLHR
jgi:hypothetical protein